MLATGDALLLLMLLLLDWSPRSGAVASQGRIGKIGHFLLDHWTIGTVATLARVRCSIHELIRLLLLLLLLLGWALCGWIVVLRLLLRLLLLLLVLLLLVLEIAPHPHVVDDRRMVGRNQRCTLIGHCRGRRETCRGLIHGRRSHTHLSFVLVLLRHLLQCQRGRTEFRATGIDSKWLRHLPIIHAIATASDGSTVVHSLLLLLLLMLDGRGAFGGINKRPWSNPSRIVVVK